MEMQKPLEANKSHAFQICSSLKFLLNNSMQVFFLFFFPPRIAILVFLVCINWLNSYTTPQGLTNSILNELISTILAFEIKYISLFGINLQG